MKFLIAAILIASTTTCEFQCANQPNKQAPTEPTDVIEVEPDPVDDGWDKFKEHEIGTRQF